MLVTECSSLEMISIASHNSWARTNPIALSNYQDTRMCWSAVCLGVEKQRHLVNSFYDEHRKDSEVRGKHMLSATVLGGRCVTSGEASLQSAEVLPHGKGSEQSRGITARLTPVGRSSR